MAGPVVGIVGSEYVVPRFWGELPVSGAPTSYVDAVRATGAMPVILPGSCSADQLDLVDALVLIGGGDVDPQLYGGDPALAKDVDPARDRAELAVLRAAAERRLPLLAVCRGLQVLAVGAGGSLAGDLGAAHVAPGVGHEVVVRPGSLLESLLGPRPTVSALHHQAVADPGAGWTVTAWTDDGTIEACEWTGTGPWQALAVQWHPELDTTGPALFGWLVGST